MADKDQLQSSINKLDNTMNALDKTVKGLTKAFNDMNRTEKSRKAIDTNKPIGDSLKLALEKYGPHKKDGSLYKDYEKAIDKLVNSNKDFLIKYDKIREQGYNKDNPSNKIKDVYGIKEVQKRVDEILSDLSNLKRGSISKEDSKAIREELYGNTKGVSVDNAYKFIQAMDGGSDAILRTAGIFAQVRSEVVAFQSAIQSATKTVTDNLSGSSKRVNTRLSKMAADSKTLKDVVANLSSTVTRANNAVDRFTDRLNTASALISANNRRLNGSVMSMNTLVKKVQKTSNTITNIQNTLSRKNTASSSGGGNSFREQATRNSDRAKQAGFIALLIPALAKLLKKTPITDLFRLLALRLGSGLSGAGEHPVAGAIGLAAAPLATGALFSATFRKTLGSIGSKILGLPEIAKTSKELKKITSGFRGIPMKNWGQYIRGIVDGLKSPRNLYSRQQMLLKKGYATKVAGTAYRDPLNKMRWLHKLQPETGMVAGNQGVKVGQQLQRMFTRPSANLLGANALGRTPVGAAASKGIMKRIPILGTAISAVMEVPELMKSARSGEKGAFKKQLGKSTGGVAGGAIGAIAGGAIGSLVGPVGTAIGGALGGVIGDIAGRILGPALFDGLGVFTKNLGKDFKGIWEGLKDTFNGLMKILQPIGSLIGRALVPAFKILGGVIGGTVKVIAWTLNVVARAIGKTVNFIGDIVQKIAEGFKWLGEKLLSLPVIGPALKKLYGTSGDDNTNSSNNGNYGPDTTKVTENANKEIKKENNKLKNDNAKIDKDLKKYSDPNSVEYKKRHGELYNQYIKANTAKGENKTIAQKLGFGERDPEMVAKANAWADKMMNEEAYKLRAQKEKNNKAIASSENAIGATLPANLTTTKINGVDAVAMKDLGLKGAIAQGNSVPYIAANNAQNLKNLDNYLTAKGYKFKYTSAMGGSHAGGPRSHGAGQKVDLVLNQGGRLSKEDEKWLMKNGFIGNGAVGYHDAGSGYHYDLSVSGGKGLTEAQMAEYEKAQKLGAKTALSTDTKEETASSQIRDGLADIVGAKNKSDKQERARNVIFSAVDVTGSLGVWGITQLNNGVMRTGR